MDDFTDGDIQLTVSSDEPILSSLPERKITRCGGDLKACQDVTNFPTTASKIVQDQQEWSFSLSGFDPGLYVVVVKARDTSGNEAMIGSTNSTKAGAIKFEIDNELPAAYSTDPADKDTDAKESKKSDAEPFVIEIHWTSEKKSTTGTATRALPSPRPCWTRARTMSETCWRCPAQGTTGTSA